MVSEKIATALTELRALAGIVPAETWQRLRPIVRQLSGVMEPLQEMEKQGIAPKETKETSCLN